MLCKKRGEASGGNTLELSTLSPDYLNYFDSEIFSWIIFRAKSLFFMESRILCFVSSFKVNSKTFQSQVSKTRFAEAKSEYLNSKILPLKRWRLTPSSDTSKIFKNLPEER